MGLNILLGQIINKLYKNSFSNVFEPFFSMINLQLFGMSSNSLNIKTYFRFRLVFANNTGRILM